MQALSFAVHIPLVCFAISFPLMVLWSSSLYLRTGDELYRTLARRWSKMLVALFAVGVITGTILSFEMGLLWPGFMATFGERLRPGVRDRGLLVLHGGDLHRHLRVRLGSPFAAPALRSVGSPSRSRASPGSLMVISVNAWMQHPGGFKLRGGRAVDVTRSRRCSTTAYLWHELVHMYLAGYIVAGFLVAAVYALGRLRGRWGRYERTAFAIPLTIAALASPVQVLVGDWAARDVAPLQPIKLAAMEGLYQAPPEERPSTCSAGTPAIRSSTGSRSRTSSRCSPSTAGMRGSAVSTPSPPTSARRSTSCAVSFQRWSASACCWRSRIGSVVDPRPAERLPRSPWFYRAVVIAGPASVVALMARLGHDRGGPPAVGRLRRDAHRPGRHRRGRHPCRLRHARAVYLGLRRRGRLDPAPARRSSAGASNAADPRFGEA